MQRELQLGPGLPAGTLEFGDGHVADLNLGLAVPLLLSAIGWRAATRFARACLVFAAGLVGIYFFNSNFAELRAMMPVLLLMIPTAMTGLAALMPSSADIADAQPAESR